MYRIKTRYKNTKEQYTTVRKGTGDGGGIRNFKTKRAAETYARQLKSFDTKIIKVNKPKKRGFFEFDF